MARPQSSGAIAGALSRAAALPPCIAPPALVGVYMLASGVLRSEAYERRLLEVTMSVTAAFELPTVKDVAKSCSWT